MGKNYRSTIIHWGGKTIHTEWEVGRRTDKLCCCPGSIYPITIDGNFLKEISEVQPYLYGPLPEKIEVPIVQTRRPGSTIKVQQNRLDNNHRTPRLYFMTSIEYRFYELTLWETSDRVFAHFSYIYSSAKLFHMYKFLCFKDDQFCKLPRFQFTGPWGPDCEKQPGSVKKWNITRNGTLDLFFSFCFLPIFPGHDLTEHMKMQKRIEDWQEKLASFIIYHSLLKLQKKKIKNDI